MKLLKTIILVLILSGLFHSCTNASVACDNCSTENQPVLPITGNVIVVDVRSTTEWNYDGHADCSVNYPLEDLNTKVEKLKAFEKVIVVCRSGNRANTAKEILEKSGIKNVENKGAWQNIACK